MDIFYIFMFSTLWSIGLIILIRNANNRYLRWISFLMFAAGCGSFSISLMDLLLPHLNAMPVIQELVRVVSITALTLYLTMFPYAFLLSAITARFQMARKRFRFISLLLLIPPITTVFLNATFYPVAIFPMEPISIYAAVYFFTGIFFYFYNYIKEKNPVLKGNKMRTNFVFIPAILWAFFTDFWSIESFIFYKKEVQITGMTYWQVDIVIILFVMAGFLYYGLKYGFLGIKLNIENQLHEQSLLALTSGASILNHTLKNEIEKINYLNERGQSLIHGQHPEKAMETLKNIEQVTTHMLDMVNRFKEKTNEIVLMEETHSVCSLVEDSLNAIQPLLEKKQVRLIKDFQTEGTLFCDSLHIKEVLNNLFINALDVMEEGKGELSVTILKYKRDLLIEVKDNGRGMSREVMQRIFEPFFTTKNHSSHYGMGLSYSYSVMKKHGGGIRVDSKPHKGSTFVLLFPRHRFVEAG